MNKYNDSGGFHTNQPVMEHTWCSLKIKWNHIISKFIAVRKNRTVQVFAL